MERCCQGGGCCYSCFHSLSHPSLPPKSILTRFQCLSVQAYHPSHPPKLQNSFNGQCQPTFPMIYAKLSSRICLAAPKQVRAALYALLGSACPLAVTLKSFFPFFGHRFSRHKNKFYRKESNLALTVINGEDLEAVGTAETVD